jgi:hypothetical protein
LQDEGITTLAQGFGVAPRECVGWEAFEYPPLRLLLERVRQAGCERRNGNHPARPITAHPESRVVKMGSRAIGDGKENRVPDLKKSLGSIKDLLDRHGFNPRPSRLLCPNPSHQDRRPGSVSLYRARDGDERIKCWSCGLDEDGLGLAKLLGEDIKLPSRERRHPQKKVRPPKALSELLASRESFPLEWEVARLLACVSEWESFGELARNWPWLKAQDADLPLICRLAQKLRELMADRFGIPPVVSQTEEGEPIIGPWPLQMVDDAVGELLARTVAA